MKKLEFEGRYYRMYPPERFDGYVYEKICVDLERTAFVLVDVYGLGFSEEDSALAHDHPSLSNNKLFEMEKKIICQHIKPALDAARSVHLPIIYISNSGPRIYIKNSEIAKQMKRTINQDFEELFREDNVDPFEYHYGKGNTFLKHSKIIEPREGDYYIRKYYYSGFYETRLDSLLRNLDIKTIVYVGFSADCCLHSTMIDGLNRNYETILLRDCTLAVEIPGEDKELYFTERIVKWAECFLGRTATSEDFIEACNKLTNIK